MGFSKHNMSNTSTYVSWDHMLQRCTNSNNTNYKNYGGRGIGVCDRWKDFSLFFADMGERPKGLTLDRIDNNKGYSPDNCRWTDPSTQVSNTRIRIDNSSGFKGVYEDKREAYKYRKWYAEIKRNGKKNFLGYFSTPKEAHLARMKALETY